MTPTALALKQKIYRALEKKMLWQSKINELEASCSHECRIQECDFITCEVCHKTLDYVCTVAEDKICRAKDEPYTRVGDAYFRHCRFCGKHVYRHHEEEFYD